MSYIQFQQGCKTCLAVWNAAFGIVGTTRIAEPPAKCPHCGSTEIVKVGDGWNRATVSSCLRKDTL